MRTTTPTISEGADADADEAADGQRASSTVAAWVSLNRRAMAPDPVMRGDPAKIGAIAVRTGRDRTWAHS